MSVDDYTLGGAVEIRGSFTDANDAAVDPTGLTLTVEKPDGTEVSVDPLDFAHPSVGEYRAPYLPDVAGTHRYLWLGTGLRPVATDGEFYVREPLTSPSEGWQPPSASQVWEESRLDFSLLGYTSAAKLEPLVASAVSWVAWVTGRTMDDSLPDELEPLARDAIRMRVEQLVGRSSPDAITTAGQEGIASVSAGGASISFRDPNSGRAQGVGGVPTSWAALNEILFALMTDARSEYWYALLTGVPAAAMATTEVNWGGCPEGIYHEDWGWGA